MNKMVVSLFIMGILFSSMALADSASDESFYRGCVTAKISQCDQKAKLASSRGENTRKSGQAAAVKAEYYRSHQEELVQMMVEDGIGTSSHKARYYLIKAYKDASSSGKKNMLAERR